MKEFLQVLGLFFLIGIPLAIFGVWYQGTEFAKRLAKRSKAYDQLGDFGYKLAIQAEKEEKEELKKSRVK